MRHAVLAVCLCVSGASAQNASDGIPTEKRAEIVAAVKNALANRAATPEQIAAAKARLTAAQAGKINPKAPGVVVADGGKRMEFPTKEVKAKEVSRAAANLKKLETQGSEPVGDPFTFGPPLFTFKVGEYGRFLDTQRVERVVGPTSALVTCRLPIPVTDRPTKAKLDVPTAVLYLDGLDTSGLADRSGASVPGIWYLAGNRQVEGRTYLRAVRFEPTATERAAVAAPFKP